MKKLALIVLLAVVASRFLADRDRDHHSRRPAPRPVSHAIAIKESAPPYPPQIIAPPAPPEAPGVNTVIPWRGGDEAPVTATPPAVRVARAKRRVVGKPVKPDAPSVPLTSKDAPAWFPKSEPAERELAQPDAVGSRVLVGQIQASPDRALADLRQRVNREVADWLAADVPPSWVAPSRQVDRMIGGTHVLPVTFSLRSASVEAGSEVDAAGAEVLAGLEDLQTLYRAGQKLDFSEGRRAEFVESYHREVASARMKRSGAVIALVLALLAATSLYVRADVATRGYYTNRLRVLATLGLGAAGAVAYRYWA